MSSLDHDRLLDESPKAPRTAARPGVGTEVPKPRRTSRSSQEKAAGGRPRTPRTGAAAASTATKATVTKATAKPATKAAPAKATPAKSTPAKATTAKATAAKAAPAKAATAAKATPARKSTAAKAAPAKATPPTKATPARKTAAAKATPAKATPAKATPAKATPATRTAPIEAPEPRTATESAPVAVAVEPAALTRRAGAHFAERRRLRLGAATRRRPAVLLAAGLVGALSVGLFGAAHDRAAASSAAESRSVSVAQALGLTAATHTAAPAVAADQLRMVAASRAQRQAEQTAAARAQAAADRAAIEAARPKAVNPAPGTVLTTCFCMRWGTMHWGIDLAAPLGTPEYAAMDGVVVKAGPASGFGQAVYIQHANGDVTVYGHMEKILVTTGQVVHAGDEIALMGAEGEATGSHLHFEVHVGGIQGQKVDPIAWLRERGVQV